MKKANQMRSERIIYRDALVKELALELGILAAECETRAQFEAESMTWLYKLFDRFDIEAREYYRLCYHRAILLDTVKWCKDGNTY